LVKVSAKNVEVRAREVRENWEAKFVITMLSVAIKDHVSCLKVEKGIIGTAHALSFCRLPLVSLLHNGVVVVIQGLVDDMLHPRAILQRTLIRPIVSFNSLKQSSTPPNGTPSVGETRRHLALGKFSRLWLKRLHKCLAEPRLMLVSRIEVAKMYRVSGREYVATGPRMRMSNFDVVI
jgi:hypothetical protein